MIDLHEGVRELFLDAQTYTVERVYAAVADRLCAEDVGAKAYHKKSYDKRRVEVLAQKAEYRESRRRVLRLKDKVRRGRRELAPMLRTAIYWTTGKGKASRSRCNSVYYEKNASSLRTAAADRVADYYAANRDAINAKRRARYAALRSK